MLDRARSATDAQILGALALVFLAGRALMVLGRLNLTPHE